MVDPTIWGKHGWKFLHYVAQGYPDNPTQEEISNYKHFFTNIANILPCYKCKQHYSQHLKNMPINNLTLNSKTNLEDWVISVHNQVNLSNQKNILPNNIARQHILDDTCKTQDIPYQQDNLPHYSQIKNIPLNNTTDHNIYIVTICILIALSIFLYFRR